MNKKHINAQLCRKFDEFVSNIENEEIKKIIEGGTIITGGALVSLLSNEPPHDYDIYFKDFKTCFKVAEYFVNKFNGAKKSKKAELKVKLGENWISFDEALKQLDKEPRIKVFISSSGVAGDEEILEDEEMQTNIEPNTDIEKELEEKPKYKPKFLTSNAISLSGKIQLVIRFYGEPDKLHENYDFVHCTNYWTSWERKVILKQEALEAIINKELLYVGSKYPLCSIIRTRKFIKRGWTINAGQYLKMAMQLNELNLKDVNVLEDQLVGVDSGYFSMLINAIQKKKEEDSGFEINNSYVAAIVDKIF
jgi:hypothetical protein